jgi:hypothetical protein
MIETTPLSPPPLSAGLPERADLLQMEDCGKIAPFSEA